jgi:hypothetical protein
MFPSAPSPAWWVGSVAPDPTPPAHSAGLFTTENTESTEEQHPIHAKADAAMNPPQAGGRPDREREVETSVSVVVQSRYHLAVHGLRALRVLRVSVVNSEH